MSRLLILILVGALCYGGWRYYLSREVPVRSSRPTTDVQTPKLSLQDPQTALDSLGAVLGASITQGVAAVGETLNSVSGGRSEPLINQAISNFQKELSTLPEDQVKKLQYNYCKGIVQEYESTR